jgi:hypothetical protein
VTAPRRRGPAPVGPGASTAAMKGLILVACAVLLGGALFLASFDDGGPLNTGSGDTSSGATTTTVAGGGTATTTTVAVAHNPAEVKVLVLNGVDKAKPIAGTAAGALKSANYTTLAPGDAATTVPTSSVYYTPGYEADAHAIASKLGIPDSAVAPLPTPLPASVTDPKDANVVVVVGPDAGVIGGAPTTTAAN